MTSEEGDLVGKGPAVSVGETRQVPELVPEPVSIPVPVLVWSVVLLLLHEPASGAIAEKPKAAISPFFKKSFLSILIVLMSPYDSSRAQSLVSTPVIERNLGV